jgi:hypothetical protein
VRQRQLSSLCDDGRVQREKSVVVGEGQAADVGGAACR